MAYAPGDHTSIRPQVLCTADTLALRHRISSCASCTRGIYVVDLLVSARVGMVANENDSRPAWMKRGTGHFCERKGEGGSGYDDAEPALRWLLFKLGVAWRQVETGLWSSYSRYLVVKSHIGTQLIRRVVHV